MRRAQPWRTNRARVLRANAPSAEDLIWQELRGRRLAGLKFIRQAAIGTYFVDFVCRERKVVVEIDGATHGTEIELANDAVRSKVLADLGYRIFRAYNVEVHENLPGVLDTLLAFVEESSGDTNSAAAPHPNPLPVAKSNGERE